LLKVVKRRAEVLTRCLVEVGGLVGAAILF
jgi:hypothetical protein